MSPGISMGWEKLFSCARCGKKLWTTYKKLPDGQVVCIECYMHYVMQTLDKINDSKAYDIVFNFVEKYGGNFPRDLVPELVKLLEVKYKLTVDTATLIEVLEVIKTKIEKDHNLVKLAKLERDLKGDGVHDFFCEVCNVKLPKSEFDYSMTHFGKPLCVHHQREKRASPHALKLYESLRKRGVFCELEPSNKVNHIDIAVKDARLYIGIDGEHHDLDAEQLYADLAKDEESFKDGFATKRYPLKEVDEQLEGVSQALVEVINRRIKKIQQDMIGAEKPIEGF